jgi:mannitol-1-phosphate/altronate dehydrogenase
VIDLRSSTLDRLPAHVQRFAYDRSAVRAGIVHLSVGNFHRAHQAWFLDRLLALPGNAAWGICGVGLIDDPRERAKAEGFPAQDCLYTLTRYPPDRPPSHQVIGAMVEYLFAPDDPEAVLVRMTDPAIRVVTLTITEGGYNQDKKTGEYLFDFAITKAELASPQTPRSAFGFIVEALRRRRAAGIAPFTVASCDNLRENGKVTHAAVVAHAGALDPSLAGWIDANVAFPNAMVDGITPATAPADAERLNAATGIADRLPVFSEEFTHWVLEDRFCNGRPPLEQVGVWLVDDVHPYELAKLRMLNASHSMLSYPAQLMGLGYVREALAEPLIRRLLEQFMERDVIPGLPKPPRLDLHEYKDQLLARFANPALGDQLPRITGEGAVKLPLFLGQTLRTVLERGGDPSRLAFCFAGYVRYLAGKDDAGHAFEPYEPSLEPADRALALDPDPVAALRMSIWDGYDLAADGPFGRAFLRLRADIAARGVRPVLTELVAV